MKCVKKGNDIRRVTEKEAAQLVHTKGYEYCLKSEWKKQVRDKNEGTSIPKPGTQ